MLLGEVYGSEFWGVIVSDLTALTKINEEIKTGE
jgi:hypothetical protein